MKLKFSSLRKYVTAGHIFLQRPERQECNTVNITKANTTLSALCQVFSSLQMSFQLILRAVVPPHRGGRVTIRSRKS